MSQEGSEIANRLLIHRRFFAFGTNQDGLGELVQEKGIARFLICPF